LPRSRTASEVSTASSFTPRCSIPSGASTSSAISWWASAGRSRTGR
jgi:hypothetical protein